MMRMRPISLVSKIRIVDMSLNRSGARNTVRVLKVDINTVIKALKNAAPK